MAHNKLTTFHKELSWNTKFTALLAALIYAFSIIFDAVQFSFILPVLLSIFFILIADLIILAEKLDNRIWSTGKWIFLFTVIMLVLIAHK